ncbi:hypothetical protein, partial [Paramuribaculum intestinale]|uniref:hypothetical protein n=1 Tax=Paramuribaculum intestinale TaxID=2094151 RepID=UPI00272C999D
SRRHLVAPGFVMFHSIFVAVVDSGMRNPVFIFGKIKIRIIICAKSCHALSVVFNANVGIISEM